MSRAWQGSFEGAHDAAERNALPVVALPYPAGGILNYSYPLRVMRKSPSKHLNFGHFSQLAEQLLLLYHNPQNNQGIECHVY
jgi:hypothetical protein